VVSMAVRAVVRRRMASSNGGAGAAEVDAHVGVPVEAELLPLVQIAGDEELGRIAASNVGGLKRYPSSVRSRSA